VIDERELISRAVEVQAPPEPSFERLLGRQDRRRRNQRIRAGVLGVAIAIAVGWLGVNAIRSTPPVPADPPDDRSADLGIFEPFAGRIIYYADSDLWGVDPSAPSPSGLVHLVSRGSAEADRFASFTLPLGWSSDGTKLLFVREDPTDQAFPYDRHLFILHADGTETKVVPEPVSAATISPDGSRVVFAYDESPQGLYVVDAEGGQPVRITAFGEEPTFSPDGTQIAFLVSPRSGCCVESGREHVWVANADGTDAHEILADEPALAKGVFGLQWSPAGDRIAMENTLNHHVAIYTFAPDGSDFTKVIDGGAHPFWSPDGSRIAFNVLDGSGGLSIADADGSNVQTLTSGFPGPWHPGATATDDPPPPTTESGGARAEPYEFLDGEVTFAAAKPWDYGLSRDTATMNSLFFQDQDFGQRLTVAADPLPVAGGCLEGPAPADAEALALSVLSDPDLEATEPVAASVGGIEALQMDVIVAPGASVCGEVNGGTPQVLSANGEGWWPGVALEYNQQMRLYLLDLPEGLSARTLAIAISAPDVSFDMVVEAATPILDSFEFHPS
jgi:hypothetical protein